MNMLLMLHRKVQQTGGSRVNAAAIWAVAALAVLALVTTAMATLSVLPTPIATAMFAALALTATGLGVLTAFAGWVEERPSQHLRMRRKELEKLLE